MEIIQIVMICICGAVLMSILEPHKEFAIFLSVVISVLVFFFVLNQLKTILYLIQEISQLINLNDLYMKILLQILGITLITELGAGICKDAARNTLSKNIELAGKVLVLMTSLPIIASMVRLIEELL